MSFDQHYVIKCVIEFYYQWQSAPKYFTIKLLADHLVRNGIERAMKIFEISIQRQCKKQYCCLYYKMNVLLIIVQLTLQAFYYLSKKSDRTKLPFLQAFGYIILRDKYLLGPTTKISYQYNDYNIINKSMSIAQNIKAIWSPITNHTSKISFRKLTKKLSISIWASLIYIMTFLYYAVAKPEQLTIGMSKTAEKISEMAIPKFMRKKFFGFYSKFYHVKLNEIVEPIDSFQTFSAFFTRKIKPREIIADPLKLLCPADSKILKIAEIKADSCSIIKGASYSLCELMTGKAEKFTPEEINKLKVNPSNKLYQVIFYLAPGDYHRFHSPTDFFVHTREKIEGLLLSVKEKTLIKKKKVYEKNCRLVVNGLYSTEQKNRGSKMFMSMVMVGALNVGRIIVKENQLFERGSELGYFNLGSTIVMIFESKGITQWHKKEGDKVCYGQPLCQSSPDLI